MVKCSVTYCNLLFSVLGIIVHLVGSSGSYVNYSIESYKVCSPLKKEKIHLDIRQGRSGAFVREKNYFDRWSGAYEFNCRFEVETKSSFGIFAVIQRLSLRQNKTTNDCIDYIQFTPDKGSKSRKICGYWDKADFSIGPRKYPAEPIPNTSMTNSFFDPGGEMEVKIHVGKVKLGDKEQLDLEILFTAYTDCYKLPSSKSCGRGKCIWEGFQCDGYVNCGFGLPEDESSECIYPSLDDNGETDSSALVKIILTIVILTNIALLLVFLAFLRRRKKLCWAERSSDIPEERRVQRSPRTSRSSDGETGSQAPIALNRLSSHSQDLSPSAPREEDLPPSYESLFPDIVTNKT